MSSQRPAARREVALVAIALLSAASCSDPERDRLKATTKASYDKETGRLAELTYDANKNGRIDTWTEMDGTRPVRSRIDSDEDGKIDRWEYYDNGGQLVKVGFSRSNGDKPDSWAYSTADKKLDRVESSSAADETKIDRWERYENDVLKTAEFDENGDGRPDRRLTYQGAELVLIETEPDASGAYTKRVDVRQETAEPASAKTTAGKPGR